MIKKPMNIYERLKEALRDQISIHNLAGKQIHVNCRALSAREAIGSPEHDDYPIIKGKEAMVEADFCGAKGQAFSDDFENTTLDIEQLLTLDLDSSRSRATFVSALNAVYRHLDLSGKTVHCRDQEPVECAAHLSDIIASGKKVVLVGHQPRFLEALAARNQVRAVDMDADNIGKTFSGVTIEPPENTDDAIGWADLIFATGSTLVNGTITGLLDRDTPVIFYGVTISAAARILNLDAYCHCGH